MRTKLIIEIESRDITSEQLPMLEDDIGNKEISEDSKEYRKEWVEAIHKDIIEYINNYFNGQFEDEFLENLQEESVDGWESFEDYGIKVIVKR